MDELRQILKIIRISKMGDSGQTAIAVFLLKLDSIKTETVAQLWA